MHVVLNILNQVWYSAAEIKNAICDIFGLFLNYNISLFLNYFFGIFATRKTHGFYELYIRDTKALTTKITSILRVCSSKQKK